MIVWMTEKPLTVPTWPIKHRTRQMMTLTPVVKYRPPNGVAMNAQQFDHLVADARLRQDAIMKTKGADYTRQEADRLSNFKRTAAGIGLTPVQVWAVFANKHWDAIMAYVKTGKVESEGIEGRIDDVHNYLYLLEGILKEQVCESALTSMGS
jgi:hypothetical protein